MENLLIDSLRKELDIDLRDAGTRSNLSNVVFDYVYNTIKDICGKEKLKKTEKTLTDIVFLGEVMIAVFTSETKYWQVIHNWQSCVTSRLIDMGKGHIYFPSLEPLFLVSTKGDYKPFSHRDVKRAVRILRPLAEKIKPEQQLLPI